MFLLGNQRQEREQQLIQQMRLVAQQNESLFKMVSQQKVEIVATPESSLKPYLTYLNPMAATPPSNSFTKSIPSIPPLSYSGTQLLQMYNVPTNITTANRARKVVIAIVVAYHYGALLTDLNTYWTNPINFGTAPQPPHVTIHNLNSKGSISSTTSISSGWGQEECLDVQMICTMCPNADIHVVEANSDSFTDLNAAVQYALGNQVNADVISMSWGATDDPSFTSYTSIFTTSRNVCFCAASGDTDAASWPSVLSNCISVGGTTLIASPNSTIGRTEYTWPNAGCGYSRAVLTPSYQSGVNTSKYRCVPDISLIANPQTSVYIVYAGNWYNIGGTSVATPIFAGFLALANQQRLNSAKPALTTIYSAPGTPNSMYSLQNHLYSTVKTQLYASLFNDITIGQDQGTNSSGAYTVYNAGTNFDIATGLGSPNAGQLIAYLNSF
jgi:subtilase family serine protease